MNINHHYAHPCPTRKRRGFTLVDLLSVLSVVALLLVVVVIDLQRKRETARRISCHSNIRNLGVAMTHYHRVHRQLPVYGSGTHNESSPHSDDGDAGPQGVGGQGQGNNGKSLSFLVGILPYLDQQTLWETISQPSSETVTGVLAEDSFWSAMGPGTSQRAYRPWVTDLSAIRCPSDPRKSEITGRTNYAACLGDALDYQMDSAIRFDEATASWKASRAARKRVDAAARGAMVFRESMTFSDITDGLSNTILLAEIATDQGDGDVRTSPALELGSQGSQVPVRGGLFDMPRDGEQFIDVERPRFWNPAGDRFAPKLPSRSDEFRGMRWADARTVFTGVSTILPPNMYVQVAGKNISSPTVAPPSSFHHGGVHVLLADGSVKYIIDSIECGNLYEGSVRLGMTGRLAPGNPSPYGIWGALGTRAMNDND